MAKYSFSSVSDEYRDLWSKMKVIKVSEARAQARKVCASPAKERYKNVERRTGVPWFVVGCLHMRESNANFNTWLHNGDPMRKNGRAIQTVHVPKGRPPDPNVDWETGAVDALVTVEHLDEIKNWGPEHVAYAAEKFNGFGYRHPMRDIPSPYLWGGTNVQKPGKFVADGVYDKNVMDPQIGAMAVLHEIMEIDPTARFGPAKAEPEEKTEEVPPIPSPRADDTEKEVTPVIKSKTIWGGILTWLGGVVGTLGGAFQYIATPWGFAALCVIILTLSIGLFLIIKGRLNVQKIIVHLSEDDKHA